MDSRGDMDSRLVLKGVVHTLMVVVEQRCTDSNRHIENFACLEEDNGLRWNSHLDRRWQDWVALHCPQNSDMT